MANYYSDEDVYVNRGTFIPVNEDARELMFGIEPRPGTLYERRRHPKRAAPAPRDVQKQNRNNTFSWNLLLFLVFLGLGVSYLYKSAQSDLAPGSSFGVSFNNLWDDSRPSDSVEVAYEEESEQPGGKCRHGEELVGSQRLTKIRRRPRSRSRCTRIHRRRSLSIG